MQVTTIRAKPENELKIIEKIKKAQRIIRE
jgi:hypothetical protein